MIDRDFPSRVAVEYQQNPFIPPKRCCGETVAILRLDGNDSSTPDDDGSLGRRNRDHLSPGLVGTRELS